MKPTSKRKAGASTAAGAVRQFEAARSDLEPPPECGLTDRDLIFWRRIVRTRAREEWSESDLAFAAQLARCHADIEDAQRVFRETGFSLMNGRGTPVANPVAQALHAMTNRALAIARHLQLDAASKNGGSDKVSALRTAEREARKAIAEAAGDSLLA